MQKIPYSMSFQEVPEMERLLGRRASLIKDGTRLRGTIRKTNRAAGGYSIPAHYVFEAKSSERIDGSNVRFYSSRYSFDIGPGNVVECDGISYKVTCEALEAALAEIAEYMLRCMEK